MLIADPHSYEGLMNQSRDTSPDPQFTLYRLINYFMLGIESSLIGLSNGVPDAESMSIDDMS